MFSKVASAILIAGVAVCMAQPKIEVDNTTYNCGTVTEGKDSSTKAKFKLTNTGNEPLKISNVRPSCGCTVVKFDTLIMPGKSSTIEPVVNIRGFKSGPMTKSVTVTSNAKNNPTLTLVIQATIVPIIDMSETYITMDQPQKKTIFMATAKKDFKVSSMVFKPQSSENSQWSSNVPLEMKYQFTLLDSTREDGFKVYRLEIQPPETKNLIYGDFLITTNHSDKPELVLRGRIGEQ